MSQEMKWRDCKTDPPDDDTMVLLYAPGLDEDMPWPGWKDGDKWVIAHIESHILPLECEPTHWAHPVLPGD